MAFTPAITRPHIEVLGDSYASGEGLGGYLSGSDTASPENRCHRSPSGWGPKLKLPNATVGPTLFIACSGAHTVHLTARAQYSTQAVQLSMVDPAAAVIAVSIGGNDLGGEAEGQGLASVLVTCSKEELHPFDSCRSGSNMDVDIQQRVAGLLPKLTQLYRDLNARAPHARVIAIGYPRLFGTTDAERLRVYGANITMLEPAAQAWMNDIADELDTVIGMAADAAGVSFLDLRGPFDGHHIGALKPGSTTTNEWVNGFVAGVLTSCSPIAACASYHPNLAGSNAYASLIQTWIDNGELPARGPKRCTDLAVTTGCTTGEGGGGGW